MDSTVNQTIRVSVRGLPPPELQRELDGIFGDVDGAEYEVRQEKHAFGTGDPLIDIAISISGPIALKRLLTFLQRIRTDDSNARLDSKARMVAARAFLLHDIGVESPKLETKTNLDGESKYVFSEGEVRHFLTVTCSGEINYRREKP